MSEVGYASLGIIPSFDKFGSNLERGTATHMTAAGTSGGEKFGDAAGKSAGSRFKSGLKTAAKAGALALAGAGVAALKFAGDSLEEAREAQKVGAQTEAVIKSTGKAAKISADGIGRLSGRLSDMAGVDDEIIQDGANVLLTFTKVRNEAGKSSKIFNRATKSALNMSTALGTDLKGASIQVGKALNDPVKGVTALARAGVQFTSVQKAQIKALVEGGDVNASMAMGLVDSTTTFNNLLKAQGGDVAKTVDLLTKDLSPAQQKMYDLYAEGGHQLIAQKRILKELDTQFAGSAKAQATAADKLEVAWGNFKEEIGTQLIPVMDKLADFLRKKGIPAAQDFISWFSDKGIPKIRDFAEEVKDTWREVKKLAGFLNDLPDSIKIAGLAGLVAGGLKVKGLGFGKQGGIMGRGGALGAPVKVFETNPAAMGGGLGGGKAGGILTKITGFVGKAAIPVTVLSWGSAALKDFYNFHRPDDGKGGRAPLSMLGKGEANKAWDRLFYDDGPIRANDAFDKVRTNAADVITQGEKAQITWGNFFNNVGKPHKVNLNTEPLLRALTVANDYSRVLDNIDGRVIQTFFESVNRNNTVEDTGGRGGKTPETPETAPSGVVFQHNGDIYAPDPRQYVKWNQQRTRAGSLDGRRD